MRKQNSRISVVSRRKFLQLAGIGSGGLILGSGLTAGEPVWADAATGSDSEHTLNLFVSVAPDNTVSIVCHRSEMGQGIRTGLPQIVADEMEADWEKVNVIQGLADKRYGSQNTDGSRSIRNFYQTMRTMGASARHMLEAAAAQLWSVPVASCQALQHRVHHKDSGRSISFGELAELAASQPVPEASALKLKSSDDFNYIGKPVATYDTPDMVVGKGQYGQDVQLENMLIASIERAPVLGSTVASVKQDKARAVKGVVAIETMDGGQLPPLFHPLAGVAVLATNTWAALKGRKALEITWSDSAHGNHNSAEYIETLKQRVAEPGKTVTAYGDTDTELAKSERRHSAVYSVPYLTHAAMEPPSATAVVSENSCEIWACTQTPQSAQQNVAKALGLKPEQVKVNVTLLGGGFGRKSKPDFAVEAAVLARKMQRPVKVVWSREDDIRHSYYHAASAAYFEAGLNSDGLVTAWRQRTAFPSISGTFSAGANRPSGGELSMGFADLPFDIPNRTCETAVAEYHTRIGWMRSVANIQNAFGICSFADELAHMNGQAPDAFLQELIGQDRAINPNQGGFMYGNYGEKLEDYPFDSARLKRVLKETAAKADFSKGDGEGWGIAVHRSFLSSVGIATRVQVQDDKLKVVEMHCVADVGLTVNPDRVNAQMEGAMIFGLSLALMGEVTMQNGAVENSNFHDYPLLRIQQCPELHVHLLSSDEPPAGVGEPGVPPVAPSITNAIFAACGQRIRDLPVTKHLTLA
ncbi:xanthine dehydrogenase family protein molybdopterin-binding subunit [Microbulbifer elongatus]|uniref:Xanthine dehydrogenase family protein molybdopterin-binding subunit n=1 Tax=Microbulbifer elongatus TaxID=86173 RepID=A0ABT1P2R6_9GAMM|nr:molybdopterin cofactor-binding domain-containing protein [Microbulbifer elongatus]MCQ3830391.1 xanthine dehydrogenase family protein molybdopterin-binding subunit [Microbulbifer elongatus]